MASTEEKLQEEIHVEQAVQDIVRLIKQDARTALLIVQLLRRYQLERSQVCLMMLSLFSLCYSKNIQCDDRLPFSFQFFHQFLFTNSISSADSFEWENVFESVCVRLLYLFHIFVFFSFIL